MSIGAKRPSVPINKEHFKAGKPDIYASLAEVFLECGSSIKALERSATAFAACAFAPQRKNLLCWYPFKEDSRILALGDEFGAVTGFLAEKGFRVTAVTEHQSSCEVFAHRFSGCRQLDLYLGEIKDVLCAIQKRYTHIIVFAQYANSETIKLATRLLCENGTVLVVADNRGGLKFRAGCPEPNTGRFFYGVNGFLEGEKLSFNRREWEEILLKDNYRFRFLYPYPDYLYATEIFSDSSLPGKGTLKTYPYAFSGERLYVLDEEKALANILERGEFADYANSFLIEIGTFSDVEYAKLNCERAEKYQTCTLKIKNGENEEKTVKAAVVPSSAPHIKALSKNYKNLCKALYSSGIFIPPCEVDADKAQFPFIKGITLENLIKHAIDTRDYKLLLQHIGTLKTAVDSLSCGRSFSPSFRFNSFFEGVELPAYLTATALSHLDLTAKNIIVNTHLCVIDYSWILDFPVPVEFILFRSLYNIAENDKLPEDVRRAVYKTAGINTECIPIFLKMEEIFQNKITAGTITYNDINNLINKA